MPRLDRIFAEYGIPQTLISDNGPPFNGEEFREFAHRLGFHHRKITPLHPSANGEAERMMRTLEKAIRTAQLDNRQPWQHELYTFLRNYRATPHSTTGACPASVMFKRTINIKIPSLAKPRNTARESIRLRNKTAKDKMKAYADTHRHAKPMSLKVGDTVLVKQTQRGKFDTPFDPSPYVIVLIKGSMITARRHRHYITRNAGFFKVVPKTTFTNDSDPLDALDDNFDIATTPVPPVVQVPTTPEPPVIPERHYPLRERRPPDRYGF